MRKGDTARRFRVLQGRAQDTAEYVRQVQAVYQLLGESQGAALTGDWHRAWTACCEAMREAHSAAHAAYKVSSAQEGVQA